MCLQSAKLTNELSQSVPYFALIVFLIIQIDYFVNVLKINVFFLNKKFRDDYFVFIGILTRKPKQFVSHLI